MRFVPDTLLARLVMIFLGGFVVTFVVMLTVQLPDRETSIFRITAGRAAHRIADFVQLADRLPSSDRATLAEVANARGIRMEFRNTGSTVGPADPPANAVVFREVLLEVVGDKTPVKVAVERSDAIPPDPGQNQVQSGFIFGVQTRLSDGTWIALSIPEPRRLPRLPTRTIANLLVMMAVLAVLSFFAVRWVTRPLSRLAEAAEALGRDINRPALPEGGPREVKRAARAFNAMQERLGRYIRNRTGILTAMSHDLKTPITRLRLRAEMLEQPDVREKFVRDLAEMEHMVHSTLGFMRGLDDREPIRPIDIGALVAALHADAEELGHAMHVLGSATAPYFGKPEGLKRCLQNLLDNALRYGRDTEIAIDDASDALTLYVRDRGPGIPEDELERVFEPFYRLEGSRNQGTGGTGLGLSIARNLAQSMGGDVTLRNRDGGGLEAKLVLSRSRPAASVLDAAAGRDGTPHQANTLDGATPTRVG